MDAREYDLIAMIASFGDPVTFKPYLGQPRTLKAIVTRDEGERLGAMGSEVSELLTATVLRDETHPRYGGIAEIGVGDTLQAADGRVFTFSGNVFEKSQFGWKLEFRSTQLKQAGRHNVRN